MFWGYFNFHIKGEFLSRLGLLLISCSYLSLFVLGFLDNSRGPLYPQILAEYNLNSSVGSMIFVVPSLFSFIGSYLAKYFVQSIASIKGLFFGSILMAFGYLFFSMSPSFNFVTLSLGMFGFGLGVTSVFEHVAIQKAAGEKTRRKWLSGLHSIYAFASVVAPFLIHWSLERGHEWHEIIFYFSLVGLVIVGFIFVVMVLYSKKDYAMKIISKDVFELNATSKSSLILICIIVAFYVSAEISIATRITQLLTTEKSMALADATNYVTYFFLLLFTGRVFFTFVSFPNVSAAKLLLICHSVSSISFLLGLFVSPWFLVLCGITMAPCYALNMDYIAEVYQNQSPKVMAQVMSMTALTVLIFHYSLGVLTDMFSVSQALLLSPLFIVICIISLIIFDKKYGLGSYKQ